MHSLQLFLHLAHVRSIITWKYPSMHSLHPFVSCILQYGIFWLFVVTISKIPSNIKPLSLPETFDRWCAMILKYLHNFRPELSTLVTEGFGVWGLGFGVWGLGGRTS